MGFTVYVFICLIRAALSRETLLTPSRVTSLIMDKFDVHDEFDELACINANLEIMNVFGEVRR
jgi:hypothetical protein